MIYKIKNLTRDSWPYIAGAIAIIILSIGYFRLETLSENIKKEGQTRDITIREGQLNACHVISDPLQNAIISISKNQINQARKEISRTKNLPNEFFGDIPSDEFEKLIKQSVKQDRGLISNNQQTIFEIQSLPSCDERYAPLAEELK